jgi:hypothetical protein
MFLRKTERKKNGKTHLYWSVVESKRLDSGRVIQRHVLYLGEINSSQAEAWRKAVDVFDEDAGRPRTLALFPEDRCTPAEGGDVIRLRLSEMRLCRPRQWGDCWLAGVAVARTASRSLLGQTPAGKPQRNALERRAASVGDVSAHRAGQRMAPASPVVPRQCDG